MAPHVRSPSDYVRTQFSGFKLRCFLNFLTKKFKKHLNLKPGNSRSTMGFPELTCGAAPSTLHFSQDFGKRNSTGKCRSWPPLPAQLAQNAQNVNYLQHVGLAAALQCLLQGGLVAGCAMKSVEMNVLDRRPGPAHEACPLRHVGAVQRHTPRRFDSNAAPQWARVECPTHAKAQLSARLQ